MRRGLSGAGLLDFGSRRHRGAAPIPTRHPEEFCRKTLEQENRETSSGPTNLKRAFMGLSGLDRARTYRCTATCWLDDHNVARL